MFKWLSKLTGDPNAKVVRKMQPQVDAVNALEPAIKALSDEQLSAKTGELRQKFQELTRDERAELDRDYEDKNRHDSTVEKEYQRELREIEDAALDELLPEAFAVVREASRRTIGQRHYDVQLIGGIVLHEGKIAEMKTGEGKTLVASLPLYLNAIAGRGAHLITVNDYLAKVGGGWMAPIYRMLGLTTGFIAHEYSAIFDPEYVDPAANQEDSRLVHWRPVERRAAYHADITYGTNNEFGFDYLRDNMVQSSEQCVQRELHYAIVDEVDNILIDEARTPLIISGPAQESSAEYARFARLVRGLKRSTVSPDEIKKFGSEADGDFWIDEKTRTITLTEDGLEKMEGRAGLPEGESLYDPKHFELTHYLENALKAEYVFHRERDYIVQADGEVVIVDEFTGRTMPGRRWSNGLHQAVEAKEGVEVRRENVTLATITFQNYFRMYHKLAGMTGTAVTEAEEFSKIYKLEVVIIPTNRPVVRQDLRDQVYPSVEAKYRAVVREIAEHHATGRPVLVGTTSIENSEMLSKLLDQASLPHHVLNAKQHEREAYIVAQAGRLGAVTIATNMAGRGTDILLGGNPDGQVEEILERDGLTIETATPEQAKAALETAKAEVEAQKQKIIELGGMHIIGTERHEARRIDNQLRGRAGRQGDPGSSRFFLSLEDELMARFGRMETVKKMMDRLGLEDDVPIEAGMIDRAIEGAQSRVEGYNFDIRKHVVEYDDVVNKQREVIYADRQAILAGEDMGDRIFQMIEKEVEKLGGLYLDNRDLDRPDLDSFLRQVESIAPNFDEVAPGFEDEIKGKQPEQIIERVIEVLDEAYERQAETLADQYRRLKTAGMAIPGLEEPDQLFPHVERQVMLRAIDQEWIEYLTAVDEMRQGIGNVALAQQDPLVAFKRQGFQMFDELKQNIQRRIVYGFLQDAGNWQLMLKQAQMEAEARLQAAQTAGGSANAVDEEEQKAIQERQTKQARQAKLVQQRTEAPKIGRNDRCPCGSGKKFKQCHGLPGKEAELKVILAAAEEQAKRDGVPSR
ncbi:MAG TPA: preprotein translocase subunit SecA [Herpetosiphonaceae bacterium]